MCLICYKSSVCELCASCIKKTDTSYFVQNRISCVGKNITDAILNFNYISQTGGLEIFIDLIKEIDAFKFLIRSESESISTPFSQIKDDKTIAKLYFISQDIKALRRLLLLILIENPDILLIDFIRMNLRLLQTQFTLLKVLTGFITIDLKCENIIKKDLMILNKNLTISDLNLKLFES
ncbi:hypothetical protein KM759_gp058 [Lymphocystis disease virus 4]|uniref:Uncharacterized protein n=1 Tax=Lymphocystis disease virus 4 TaxID=2704413 RepID=A0A6B9XMZ3_9VIRU|nr:hypothetical protein KM759_gp058 [Lymphocystis disease virus 4]QHR78518.1 hypothetical protein [Lymphocystis disease virus 4]